MKKLMVSLVLILAMVSMVGVAYAIDGYVCAKDNIASKDPGKCSVCGGDLAKGDVKEVKSFKCMTCGVTNSASGKCQVDGTELVETVSVVPAPVTPAEEKKS